MHPGTRRRVEATRLSSERERVVVAVPSRPPRNRRTSRNLLFAATARSVETRAMVDEGWTTVENKAPKEAAASGRGGGVGNGKDRNRGAGA